MVVDAIPPASALAPSLRLSLNPGGWDTRLVGARLAHSEQSPGTAPPERHGAEHPVTRRRRQSVNSVDYPPSMPDEGGHRTDVVIRKRFAGRYRGWPDLLRGRHRPTGNRNPRLVRGIEDHREAAHVGLSQERASAPEVSVRVVVDGESFPQEGKVNDGTWSASVILSHQHLF